MFIDPATGSITSSPAELEKSIAIQKLEDAESRIKELEHKLAQYEKFLSALSTLDLDVSRFASMIARASCSNCRSDVDNSVCDNLFWLDLMIEVYNVDKD